MRKLIFAISLAMICAAAGVAQKPQSSNKASADRKTAASKPDQQVNLESDTQVAAQLENTLDVRRVKPGDRVVMKTLQPIKQHGQTVVRKGARLIGHVTEVAQRTESNGQSRLGVALDRLQQGSMDIPITGSITSLTQASTRATAANDDLFGDPMMSSSSSMGATTSASTVQRSGGGGLLGGVGSTVGGATSTVGSVAGNTTNTVGNAVDNSVNTTTSAARNTARGVQLSPGASASAEGGSTLSLNSGILRLESGTTFNLLISGSGSANNQ